MIAIGNDTQSDRLLYASTTWRAPKRAVVIQQGTVPEICFGVREGLVALMMLEHDGCEVVIDLLGPGEWFGYSQLLANRTSACTAVAMTPSTLLVMRKQSLLGLVADDPAWIHWLRIHSIRHSERISRRVAMLARRTASERLAALVQEYGDHLLHGGLTQTELARLLGVSRQMVNRTLRRARQ